MLDWDDDELASILWDEVPESVVPYYEGNEVSQSVAPHKVLSKEPSSYELEIKRGPDKAGFCGRGNEPESVFNLNTEKSLSCLDAEPWTDPNLSTAVNRGHDSIGTNLAGSAGTMQNLRSSGARAAPFFIDSESSQKQLEEQENGDFVDYSWADIESFDDLDKIFSNDDPIFGNAKLGSVDELWSASKDAGYSLENSLISPVVSLISLPESYENLNVHNKVRTEYTHHSNQPVSDQDNMRDCMFYDHSDVNVPSGVACTQEKVKLKLKETRLDRTEKDIILSSPNSSSSALNKLSDKVNKQKKIKNRKGLDQKMKGKLLLSSYGSQYLPGNQFKKFGKQEATSIVHSYPFSETSQPRHSTVHPESNQFSVPCENIYNQYPGMPMLPQLHYGLDSLRQKFPKFEVSHGSSLLKSSYTPRKPLFMTPQEKIDKLRRRQQMQAMHAIKKQQQELGQQTSGLDIDHLMSKKHSHDSQIETTCGIENGNEEIPTIPPYFDSSSSSEKKISNEVSKAVNELPVENSALSQLQDIISKLNSRVRLSIRDSLFRLATSAAQRLYPSDTFSANNAGYEDHKLAKDEISNHNRDVVIVDAEIETNPIDRTVAHLLFHRPFDVIAKHSETPNFSVSTQPLPECKTDSLVGLNSKDSTEPTQSLPQKESESSFPTTVPQLGTEFLDTQILRCKDASA